MKAVLKTTVIATVLTALAIGGVAVAAQKVHDRTEYDCRVVVGYKRVDRGSKHPLMLPIFVCPHKDQMAAGKCEESFWFGMRCKE